MSANIRRDIEEIIFILGDVLKLKALSGVDDFAAYDWEELPDTLRKETALAEELLAPLKKTSLNKARLEDGSLKLPPEFKEVWRKASESGVFKTSVPLKYGGKNLPLSLSLPVLEVAGMISPAFYCYLTSALDIAGLIEKRGSEEQKKLWAAGLFDGSLSGSFAISEPRSDFSLDNIQTEAFPKEGYYSIRGDKTMTAGGGLDLTDNIIYLVLARLKSSNEDEGKPALFLAPAYRTENRRRTDNNIRPQSLRQTSDPNEIPFVSLSYGRDGECRGYLLNGAEGAEEVLKAFQTAHLSAALQAAVHIRIIFESALAGAEPKPDKPESASPINESPRTADALTRMKSISEGVRIAVYSAWFLTDCGTCVRDRESFFHGAAELYGLVLKVYASESGLEMINKGLATLGSDCGPEFFGTRSRDNLIAGIFLGVFNGAAGEQLLESVSGADEGQKMKSLMERFEISSDRRPLSPNLAEALNIWKDYVGALIILTDDLKKSREDGNLDISRMFADRVLRLFAEVIVCHYLIIQGAEAEVKLKEAGVNFHNFMAETRRRPDLGKWRDKIIAAEYFALNILSSRESDVRVAQNASAAALKALWR